MGKDGKTEGGGGDFEESDQQFGAHLYVIRETCSAAERPGRVAGGGD